MSEYHKVKEIVLATDNLTERKIRFLAVLTRSLPKGKRKPVLTSGSGVEIYLDGMLRSGDMDVVYNVDELKRILKSWHFELGTALRSHLNDELGLAVNAVGEHLNGSYDRLTTMTTDFGILTVIGTEDLILKRLASAKFWKTLTDMEQSYLLAKSQESKIDWEYLESQAKKDDVVDHLSILKNSIGR